MLASAAYVAKNVQAEACVLGIPYDTFLPLTGLSCLIACLASFADRAHASEPAPKYITPAERVWRHTVAAKTVTITDVLSRNLSHGGSLAFAGIVVD